MTSLLACVQLMIDGSVVMICHVMTHYILSIRLLLLSPLQQHELCCIGAVRRNRLLKKPSNSDIEAEIKVWLRQSCDANGGRKVRGQKKARQHHQPADDDSDVEPSD